MADSREDRVIEAATGGFLGGALVGYFGGGAFNLGGLVGHSLLGIGLGVVVAVAAALLFRFLIGYSWRDVLRWLAWGLGASVALCGVVTQDRAKGG